MFFCLQRQARYGPVTGHAISGVVLHFKRRFKDLLIETQLQLFIPGPDPTFKDFQTGKDDKGHYQ